MVQYDRAVIQKFAEKLYKKANAIIASYTILGLLLGGVGGYFLCFSPIRVLHNVPIVQVMAIVAVVGALIGFAIGREKAFLLKLQAQTTLCQARIEQNTSGKIV